jgi:anti-anti-sigma factor
MKHEIAQVAGATVIRLQGQLVFGDRMAFDRAASDALSQSAGQLSVDLAGLDYMDSAGLGFLITLREQASKKGVSVVLTNPTGKVSQLLSLARFDMLFSIRQGS